MLRFTDIIIRDVILVLGVTIFFGIVYSFFPDEFEFKDKLDPYYFSFTTMASVGYGDFTPSTRRTKMIVMAHQFIIMTGILGFFIEMLLLSNTKYKSKTRGLKFLK